MNSIKKHICKELRYGAHNYNSLPVVIKKAKDIYMYDVNDNKYLDFLSCYSSVNQGHCHPEIIKALVKQSSTLTLTSRAFYNNKLGEYMEFITKLFNYQKVLPMNTGVEAGETAIKLARAWGYLRKNIPKNTATILFAENNFWGRTISACSSSTDPTCYNNFGPFTPGFETIPFNNTEILENKLKNNPNIVAFMVEPIQGEAGVIIPDSNYMYNIYRICKKYNVLLIADEIQTGLGRTGKFIACNHNKIKPDILLLGKALSGGVYPISAVLANNEIMDCITPGTHGSTYGGNPLASVIASTAIKVLLKENLINNSSIMGKHFRNNLLNIDHSSIINIRGAGLFNAIEVENNNIAEKLTMQLLKNGLLTKTTRGNVIRLSPPLTIQKNNINNALDIINTCFKNL
jgi:ornithine--oxo-acid transaminase